MRRRRAPRGCSDDDSDYCMGVGLQIFLLLLVSTCAMGVYRVCIPLRSSSSSPRDAPRQSDERCRRSLQSDEVLWSRWSRSCSSDEVA